jgi:predicted nucleic acid-binding protein
VIRAVIDPGGFVSAFIGRTGSVADQIIRAWRSGQIEIVISTALLTELSGVLARPKFAEAARDGRAVDYVEALRIGATIVEDPAVGTPITRDPTRRSPDRSAVWGWRLPPACRTYTA